MSRLLLRNALSGRTDRNRRRDLRAASYFVVTKLSRADRHDHRRARPLLQRPGPQEISTRTDQTELAHIGSLVTHYSLGHANKRFELLPRGPYAAIECFAGRRVCSERAFQVFGSEIMPKISSKSHHVHSNLRLPPSYVSASRCGQPTREFAKPEEDRAQLRARRAYLRTACAEAQPQLRLTCLSTDVMIRDKAFIARDFGPLITT